MLVSEFSFELPDDRIARYPVEKRDSSRLMLFDRSTGITAESIFSGLTDYLQSGDLLVLNDTRVIPARLLGRRASGGKVEIFLLRCLDTDTNRWLCLLKPSKRVCEQEVVTLDDVMSARVVSRLASGECTVEFFGSEDFNSWLEREGHIPLPPYLQRDDAPVDRERYQTVVSRNPGAVAAPTAGLHFTEKLLSDLTDKGIKTAFLTLHTGLGTFQPVRVSNVEDHKIHTEYFHIPEVTAEAVRQTKASSGRVIAVGTTSARTLEYSACRYGEVTAGNGEADIYIYPGYEFKVVDALITNFHLPESTLLMLVSAFAGRDAVLNAYKEAVERRFRFYSYGDAMFIY